jgi:hypothetical protein
MATQQLTSKEYFKALNIIHLALIAGQLSFVLLALFLVYSGNTPASLEEMETPFLGTVVLVFTGTFLGGKNKFKKNLKACKQKKTLVEKMNKYRSALILRYTLLEIPSFLSTIFYILSNNILLLIISVLILMLFFTLVPGKEKAIHHLELNAKQRRLLDTPKFIVAEIKIR